MVKIVTVCDNCKTSFEMELPCIDDVKRCKIVLLGKGWVFSKDKCCCNICDIKKKGGLL